jgi:putative transcriptional regulator
MPRFHIQDDLLVDYASGSLPVPVSLLVSSHLTLCTDCRRSVTELEKIGGALLEGIDPVAMAADALEATLDGLDSNPVEARAEAGSREQGHDTSEREPIPLALSRLFDGPMDDLAWKRRARGIDEIEVPCGDEHFSASLLRIQPGVSIPNHTHKGEELTLVLRGGFSDALGHYGRGDVCHASAAVAHAPAADAGEVCLCLVVADGPVKLTGLVGRMLNPFLKL